MTEETDMVDVPAPKAPELLGRAAALLSERGKEYDQPQGWLFMMCLKQVRAFTGAVPHEDSLHDLIAYTALMAEEGLA